MFWTDNGYNINALCHTRPINGTWSIQWFHTLDHNYNGSATDLRRRWMKYMVSRSDDRKSTKAATGHRYHLNGDEKQKQKSVNIKDKDAQLYITITTTQLLERDSTEKSPLYVILFKQEVVESIYLTVDSHFVKSNFFVSSEAVAIIFYFWSIVRPVVWYFAHTNYFPNAFSSIGRDGFCTDSLGSGVWALYRIRHCDDSAMHPCSYTFSCRRNKMWWRRRAEQSNSYHLPNTQSPQLEMEEGKKRIDRN